MPKRKRGPMPARIRQVRQKRATFKRRNVRTGGFLGIERKFFDTEVNNGAFATSWTIEEPATTGLTAIAQGDGESNRDGKNYIIDSIHIKGFLNSAVQESQTAPLADILCRLVLVLDTQTNGAVLTATSVMDAGQSDDVIAFRNLQFTRRFKVLWDRSFVIKRNNTNEGAANLFAAAATNGPFFKVNHVFKGGLPVTMSSTEADIANVTDNSIHMIGIATSTDAMLDYQCRVRFRG